MIQQRWHKRDEKTIEITLSGPRQGILQWWCWIFQEKVGFNKHYRKKLRANCWYCQIVKFVQIKCVLCGVKRVWLACMELLGIRSLLCCIFLELQATAYQSIGAEGNTFEIPATNSLLLALRRPWKDPFHFSFGARLEQQKDRERARISAQMSKGAWKAGDRVSIKNSDDIGSAAARKKLSKLIACWTTKGIC